MSGIYMNRKRNWRVAGCLVLALGLGGAASCATLANQPAAAKLVQVTPNPAYQAIAKREFGTMSKELDAVEKEVEHAPINQYPVLEAQLVGVLENPAATVAGKQFACQMLRIVASPACVPAVSKLLTDEKLSHMARYVLLELHDPMVDKALCQALAQTQGKVRIGIINTMGDRPESSHWRSINTLKVLVNGSDEAAALATLNALGKIGGTRVADVLDHATVADTRKEAWASAYLRCASSVAAAGNTERAEKMCQTLVDGAYPAPVAAGAFVALVRTQNERAVPLIVKMLFSDNTLMQRAAESSVIAVPGHAATKALVQSLMELKTPEEKIGLLTALAARGDAVDVTAPVNHLAADSNADVRQAAIEALAQLGDASSVPVLAAALKEDGAIETSAHHSLKDLQGPGVAEALAEQSTAAVPPVRVQVLALLAERHQTEALPAIRRSIHDKDAAISRAALRALAVLGTQDDFKPLLEMLLQDKDDGQQSQIAATMSAIGRRIPDKAALSTPVLQALPQADAKAKLQLFNVLSGFGGTESLQAARSFLTSDDAQVKKAAVRLLADWPDATPMADLLGVTKNDGDDADKILALRGYIRMAGLTGNATQKVENYQAAMALAARPDEKRLVLAGLSDVADAGSLKMTEGYLDDAALKSEAFTAYEKIAEALKPQDGVAKAALERVAQQAPDENLRTKAKKAANKIVIKNS